MTLTKMKKPYSRRMKAENSPSRHASLLLVGAMTFFFVTARAQTDSVDHKKIRRFAITSAAAYTAGILTLNHVWYKDTEKQSFRFFNDNAEWKQMDKAGHFFASFQLSRLPAQMLQKYGVPARKADLIGALSG